MHARLEKGLVHEIIDSLHVLHHMDLHVDQIYT